MTTASNPQDVIVAADFPTEEELWKFLETLGEHRPFLKVGMELFYSAGPQIVEKLKERGYNVFLDLKLHDIPNTVSRAMSVLRDLGADMVNLHASGGKEMMEAAVAGLTRPDGTRPILLGVTQLTSTSQEEMNEQIGIPGSVEDSVIRYAQLAQEAGLDGVVCSAHEAAKVKEACGDQFLTVTPGIRFAGGEVGDQSRVATPETAAQWGCDYLVMGRPVTQADDPAQALERAVQEFLGVNDDSAK